MKAIILLKTLLLGKWIRNNNMVLVFSTHHNFTGNCKYAVLAIRNHFPKKNIIWVVEQEQQRHNLERHNIQTVLRKSPELTHIIRQTKYIISDGNIIVSLYAHGATQIDFWHGTPLKKIRFDMVPAQRGIKKWARKIFFWLNRKNFIQSGGSTYDAEFLAQTARLPKYMARPLGLPCIAPLVDTKILHNEIQQNPQIKKLYEQNTAYKKVYLYAPTFRDDNSDFLTNLHFDIQKLDTICTQKNIRFMIKLHPWCTLNISSVSDTVKILDSSYDATLCMAISDGIITDYSSIYFNAVVTDKDIILMHGDIQQYISHSRDIYQSQLQYVCGHIINNFDDLCTLIQHDTPISPVPKTVIDIYWDKKNIQNPYRFLKLLT